MSWAAPDNVKLAVVGLGYVGLPLAIAFARHSEVIGYDINRKRVSELNQGHDSTGEANAEELSSGQFTATDELSEIRHCNVYIVTVPTPVDRHNYPDLTPLVHATRAVASCLQHGDCVIYESTVYPGATEETCVPLLEEVSGLGFNVDFAVGYSPERINPGDRVHRLPDIVKVTSGSSAEAAEFVDGLYQKIITAGTHLAPSIRVAEAAKAIENTQRDVNIALVNELARMFKRMDLDTESVLAAAASKWNFLDFKPGLVGGHCIGVDPYYLIHKAQEHGYHPELILAARRINNSMADHVTGELLKLFARRQIHVVGARVLVLGVAFKENCPDLRNTQVATIVHELQRMHANVEIYDPWVDSEQLSNETGLHLSDHLGSDYDAVVLAVAHREFVEMGADGVRKLLRKGGVVYDVKCVLPAELVDGRL
ncbi:MAG: nucleotide sugar dehydrogenase [Lysobacteraceae bacterium]|nr:MAG: nucleotide sugar dehydrogenase [Xanthomonadaceae bacterium]